MVLTKSEMFVLLQKEVRLLLLYAPRSCGWTAAESRVDSFS
jgi:hypothetical protein